MKKIFLVFGLLLSVLVFSKPSKHSIINTSIENQDTLYWKGKPITRKSLNDSFRVLFFKIYDSIENETIKTKNKKS